MFQKHYFKVDERVQMNRTTSPLLDGKYGTILGKAIRDEGPHPEYYIILLDERVNDERAIVLTETCIDRPKKIVKKPGPDWEVTYRVNETGATAEMLVFGQPNKEAALSEAHYSLSATEKDWYSIVRVVPV